MRLLPLVALLAAVAAAGCTSARPAVRPAAPLPPPAAAETPWPAPPLVALEDAVAPGAEDAEDVEEGAPEEAIAAEPTSVEAAASASAAQVGPDAPEARGFFAGVSALADGLREWLLPAAFVHDAPGGRVAGRAAQLVGKRLRKVSGRVPDDCSGLVRLAFEAAGVNLVSHGFARGENAVSAMWRRALEAGALHTSTPRPGDLAFFRETYDRNRDGRRNDGLTHVGVVEAEDRDGAVTLVHRGSKGVGRTRLNVEAPSAHRTRDGRVLNDYLRAANKKKGQRAWLTGELFVGYAALERM